MEKFNSKIVVICFFVYLITMGCGSDDGNNNDNIPSITIEKNFTIGKGATLTYDLGPWQIEGGFQISLQPKKFQVSHIVPNPLGGLQYEYVPIADFIGNDYLEITNNISAASNVTIAKTIHKITIEVTSD